MDTMWSCKVHNIASIYSFHISQPVLCHSSGIDDTLPIRDPPVTTNTQIKTLIKKTSKYNYKHNKYEIPKEGSIECIHSHPSVDVASALHTKHLHPHIFLS